MTFMSEIARVVARTTGNQEAKRGAPNAIFGRVCEVRMGTKVMDDRNHTL